MNPMYAIVKTGGKQYRVEEGQTLLVERLPVDEGASVSLETLMIRGEGDAIAMEASELTKAKVEAKVLAHERGPKLRVAKFKPKRGYRNRNGHRQSLTRIEVTKVALGATKAAAAKTEDKPAAEKPAAKTPAAKKPAAKTPAAKKPAVEKED